MLFCITYSTYIWKEMPLALCYYVFFLSSCGIMGQQSVAHLKSQQMQIFFMNVNSWVINPES